MSAMGFISGSETLLVGVEWDTFDGEPGIRVYLGHRAHGRYAIVTDPEARNEIVRWWDPNSPFGGGGGHITIPTPSPDCIFLEGEGSQQ